ncbi:MAG: tetratricopeptide repeat protein [Myxococcota bacterium]
MVDLSALLSQAASHYQSGEYRASAGLLLRILNRHPDHADALYLLALCLWRLGHLEDAVQASARAVAADPEHAVAWLHRGRILHAAGEMGLAAEALQAAVRLRPGFTEAEKTLAGVRLAQGDVAAAEVLLRGRDDPQSKTMRGIALRGLGRTDEAVEILSTVTGLPPDLSAWLAGLLVAEGRYDDALPHAVRAVRADSDAHHHWIQLVDVLFVHPSPPQGLRALLTAALQRTGLDHQRLDRAIRANLDPEGVLEDPLLGLWLTKTIVQDVGWEQRLTALRRAILLGEVSASIGVMAAFGWQGFHTGYAWWESEEEGAALDALGNDALDVAKRAMFRPMTGERPMGAERLSALWDRQVAGAAAERARAEIIETIAMSDDAVSQVVRAQYEANPYPRLVSLHRTPPMPFDAALRARLPNASVELPPLRGGRRRVLVAGCGTGQHALTVATRYADVSTLAVDLSRASLSRASLWAERWGVTDLTFKQADILALDVLDETFDVVESVGVLHHMARPQDGLAALVRRTRPGGVLRLGLYSERARGPEIAARALAAEQGWSTDAAGLRAARRALMGLPPDHPAYDVVRSPDFFSVSGVRDLVLHEQEHRYTLPALYALLTSSGLRFLGFQLTDPRGAATYRRLFPDDAQMQDLSRWSLVEAEIPRLFVGMYLLWCQRVSS